MERLQKLFTKKNLLIAGLIVILGIVCYLFMPFFYAKNIVVLGNSSIRQESLPLYTSVSLDRNVFLIDRKKIKEDFLENPYIKSIEIKPKFPRILLINITERKAVATVKFAGGFAIIDDKGIVLETTQDTGRIVKPTISGINPKDIVVGEVMQVENDNLAVGMEIISNIKSAKLLQNISLIDISDLKNISMITPQGIHVLIGEGKDLNEKMLVLNKILINLFERNVQWGVVDMRFDADPVYRSKK